MNRCCPVGATRCDLLAVCQGHCAPLGPQRVARVVGRHGDRVVIEEVVKVGPGTPFAAVAPAPALPVWVAKKHHWRMR